MTAALATLVELARGGARWRCWGTCWSWARARPRSTRPGRTRGGGGEAAGFFGPVQAGAGAAGAGAQHFEQIEPLLAWLKPQLRAGDVVLVKASRG